MATLHPTTPVIGPTFNRRTSAPEFSLGTVVTGNDNKSWIYAHASTEAVSGTCTLNTTGYVLTDAAGNHTASAAFAVGEYGWVYQTAGIHA